MHFSTLLAAGGLVRLASAAYSLADDFSGDSFFNGFNFETETDPTNGYVNYLSKQEAQTAKLWDVTNGVVNMRVDSTNVASGRGRDSIRVSTGKTYQHALVVLDLAHMPGNACGIWPAFWMLGPPTWPANGEIDIIEGVNHQSGNAMTMHTSDGCSMAGSSCLANKGCSVDAGGPASYGDGLNQAGGGVYATEWNSDHISIWFWPKGQAPSDATGAHPDPTAWGTPIANFQGGSGCNIDQHFNNMQLVFDTTFCGDWAGQSAVFGADSQCSGTCQDYVQNNPKAFTDAYWSINALKVYSSGGAGASVSGSGSANATPPVSTGQLSSIQSAPSSILSAPSSIQSAPSSILSAPKNSAPLSASFTAQPATSPANTGASAPPVTPTAIPTTHSFRHPQPAIETMSDGHWNVGFPAGNPPKERRAAPHRAARHLAQHARKAAEART